MRDRLPWLRLLGALWLLAGVAGLLWSALSLLPIPFGQLLPSAITVPLRALLGAFVLYPWAQIAATGCSVFCLVAGWGLTQRSSWVQGVVVPAHMLFVVYALVGAVLSWVMRDRATAGWQGRLALLSVLALVNLGLAALLSSVRSTEAFSWLPLRTAPVVPLRCEFCGTPLDPQTNRCPQCESVPEIVSRQLSLVPPMAKLVSLVDDSEHLIDPGKRTLVGRGLSDNDVNVNNPTVSRHHAQIEYRDGRYVLSALRDSNGTFVNETLVRQRTLQDGDEVRFGRASYRFTILEPQEVEA